MKLENVRSQNNDNLVMRNIALWSVLAGLFVFMALLLLMRSGALVSFDTGLLLSFRHTGNLDLPVGPSFLPQIAEEMTALGGYPVITLFTTIVCTLLLILRHYRMTAFLALTMVLGTVLNFSLKTIIARPRPDLVIHLDMVHTASFPSGHAMMSMVAYLSFAVVVGHFLRNVSANVFLLLVALFLSAIIGLSRVYLGVHWPSDVLAGWALGIFWVGLATWSADRWGWFNNAV